MGKVYPRAAGFYWVASHKELDSFRKFNTLAHVMLFVSFLLLQTLTLIHAFFTRFNRTIKECEDDIFEQVVTNTHIRALYFLLPFYLISPGWFIRTVKECEDDIFDHLVQTLTFIHCMPSFFSYFPFNRLVHPHHQRVRGRYFRPAAEVAAVARRQAARDSHFRHFIQGGSTHAKVCR
jgi:hypothetical protein